jgi:hypothetical protein
LDRYDGILKLVIVLLLDRKHLLGGETPRSRQPFAKLLPMSFQRRGEVCVLPCQLGAAVVGNLVDPNRNLVSRLLHVRSTK